MRFAALVQWICIGSLGSFYPTLAEADESPVSPQKTPPSAASNPVLEPPSVKQAVPAQWPDGLVVGEPVSVLLEMVIDTQGKATRATVLRSGGEPFDRAALAAIHEYDFIPAHRNGEPVATKIRFELWVSAPPVAKDAPPPEEKVPAADASAPSASAPVAQEGSPSSQVSLPVEAASPPSEDEGFGATAEIRSPPREVTRRSIEVDELTKIPGTGGDALRAIEVMPGVAHTSISQGDPVIRGSAPVDSLSLVAGVPVPLLFHFGGVKSSFNSRLLERVDLYPGNFSARYGRVMGGVIEATVREPKRDRPHGLVELSLLDSSVLAEGPLGPNAGIALAVRRSNIDLVFGQMVPKNSYSVLAAPVYWDYQAVGTLALSSRHRLRILAFGSRDSLSLQFANPSSADAGLRGNVAAAIEYHRVQAALESELSPQLNQKLALTWGKFDGTQETGPLGSNFSVHEVFGRGEWRYALGSQVRVNLGFDVATMFLSGQYQGTIAPQSDGDPNMDNRAATQEIERVSGHFTMVKPAAYLEAELRPVRQLLLVPGVRLDWSSDIQRATVDPRLVARYEIAAPTTLKWGVGVYSQPPQYYEALKGFGNPGLSPSRAFQVSAGVEQRLGDLLQVGAESFFKALEHRVVATEGGVPPAFVNDGVGRIYGAELSAKLRLPKTFAYFAYTISRSERRERNQDWHLFSKDQTHILALTLSHQLGRGWEVGARFRLASGNPYTPVNGAMYDAGIDQYRPLYGAAYSARNPLFQQLDIRVEKNWKFSVGNLALYVDLQNSYNAKNAEGFDYSFDYRRRQRISGLPVFPNLGIRGEL